MDTTLLFDGNDALFRAAVADARIYGEYGLGASTLWIDQNTDAQIIGVETSASWLEQVTARLTRPDHDIRHINVGPVAKWGLPRSYRKRRNFIHYVEGIWKNASPEVVLIDGRFRVACFLTCLLRARPGCVVVFDDYVDRKTYHVVEEVLTPEAVNTRQAVFIVPETLDMTAVKAMRDQFVMVMD